MEFSPRHIPAPVIASSTTLGGLWPIFNPRAAMLEFGLPRHIAGNPAAAPVMVLGQARNRVLGLLIFWFYYQRKYTEIDQLMVLLAGYVGVVDCVQLAKVGQSAEARAVLCDESGHMSCFLTEEPTCSAFEYKTISRASLNW